MKRALDLILSATALVLLMPLIGAVAAAIGLSDRGPVLYSGQRVGRYGVPFRMCKFRTMVVYADRLGETSASGSDPRITPLGRFLRRSKLDELPQLLNVLAGQMSLVGPRPEVPEYVAMFTPAEQVILSVRPGITDWASLWNSDEGSLLSGHADPDAAYARLVRPTKLRLQLLYVSEPSMQTDLQILLLTLLKLTGFGGLPSKVREIAGT